MLFMSRTHVWVSLGPRKNCSFSLCMCFCLCVDYLIHLFVFFSSCSLSFGFHHLGRENKNKTRWKSGSNACWWFSIVKRSSMKSLIFRSRAKKRKRNSCKNIQPIKAQRSAIKSPDMHYPHKYSQIQNIAVRIDYVAMPNASETRFFISLSAIFLPFFLLSFVQDPTMSLI